MNYLYLSKKGTVFKLVFFLIIFLFCFCEKNNLTAESLIEKSIQAHGGLNLVKQFKSIQYNKSTKLYSKNGELENHLIQKINHQWDPFLTSIEWKNSEGFLNAKKKDGKVSLKLNNILIKDSLKIISAESNLDAAFYVFWQPFQLLEPAAKKVLLGSQKIMDSIDVIEMQVSYSDEVGADQWYYFFDQKNFKIRGVKVEHKKRISLIINELYETKTGLSLNKSRKSYFLDSKGKVKYLRAAYEYEILSFNYKK